MFHLIFSHLNNAVSQSQILFANLFNTMGLIFFLINYVLNNIYNSLRALYSFSYVAFYAPDYVSKALYLKLIAHKKNAYQLARAVCLYQQHFGHHSNRFDEHFAFITTPQNIYPYESVELSCHFINNQNFQFSVNSRKSIFKLASKACCWGVAQPYRQAVDHLLATRSYSNEIGLRLLSLDPDEMVPYAQQIASGGQALTHDYSNIGAMLPPEQTPHSFRTLLDRIMDSNRIIDLSGTVGRKVAVDMKKILHFFHTHPEHLSWADEIASQALGGCVNQPLMGWLEICAWVHIAKQPTIIKKLEAANFLQAFSHVKLIIANNFSNNRLFYPEYICAMMQSLYYKLCSEQVITEPWIGICDELWERYRQALQVNPYFMFQRENTAAAVRNMTIADAIETVFMQSAGRAFWARIAVPQEELRSFSAEYQKEKYYLQQVVLYLTGAPLADAYAEIGEQGYPVAEFERFVEEKCPGHESKTVEEKIEAVGSVNQELNKLGQFEEIGVNQKALLWTTRQIRPANNPAATNGSRPTRV